MSRTQTSRVLGEIDLADEAPAPERQRICIVHYHLFKNAGTSLDEALQANFGASWANFEGDTEELPSDALGAYLNEHPWVKVVSSHKALLPPPRLANLTIVPALFIRHPLDRIRSVYDFERGQDADTDGAKAAKKTDLPGYIDWRLHREGDRAIVNFQAYRLAMGGIGETERERAMSALDLLPFVGLVEDYGASLKRLERVLSPHYPDIRLLETRANVTQRSFSLPERLRELKASIGRRLYAEIEAANALDLAIWDKLRKRYLA